MHFVNDKELDASVARDILSTTKATVLNKLYPLYLLYLMCVLLPLPLFLPPSFLLTLLCGSGSGSVPLYLSLAPCLIFCLPKLYISNCT